MAIKFITGGSGSGKSYVLNNMIISEAVDNPNCNYIVVVPEQYTMETQRELVAMHPRHGLVNIDIVSFKRLAFRVFEELGTDVLEILDDTGKNLILRKVIENNKEKLGVYKNKTKMQGFIEKVKSSVSELYQYNVDDKVIEKLLEDTKHKAMLNGKIKDIAVIYDEFNKYIKDKYITKEEILKVLYGVVSKSRIIKNSKIYFDGFTGFTPIQYDLIGELDKYAKEMVFTVNIDCCTMKEMGEFGFNDVKEQELFKMSKDTINELCKVAEKNNEKTEVLKVLNDEVPYRLKGAKMLSHVWSNIFRYKDISQSDENNGEIEIYACRNSMEEALKAASIISKKVLENGARYRDFAVVSGAQDSYADILEEAMKKYDIPCFVDGKRSILGNPFVNSIKGVLSVVSDDFSYDSVMKYLRTGMSSEKTEDIDLFENYILACGIRGYKRYNVAWKRTLKNVKEDKLEIINRIRENFVHTMEPLKAACGKDATVEGITRELYYLIVAENMEQKLYDFEKYFADCGRQDMEKEYSQVYKCVMDLFDKFVILLGNEKVTVSEYMQILDAGLEEIKVSIVPPTLDQVVIGDIKRTRLSHIKHIILVGANDGIIPLASGSTGLFSQNDREYLKKCGVSMSPSVREDGFIQRFYLYMLLTKPEERLTLTYSEAATDGKEQRASYLVGSLRSMFPNIEIKRVCDEDIIITPQSGLDYVSDRIRKDKGEAFKSEYFTKLMDFYLHDEGYRKQVDSMIKGANYRNVSDSIGKSVAKALYGQELVGSVTRLESYAECAYKHFLSYGLKLYKRALHEINVMDVGTMYHSVLQGFFEEIKENNYNWKDVDEELRDRIIEKNVVNVCKEYEEKGLFSSATNAYVANMVSRVSKKVADILVEHIGRGKFEPTYYELSFGIGKKLTDIRYMLDEDTCLRLGGIIDRVDICNHNGREYVKIIDYKKKDEIFKLPDVYEGLQLQMVVYLDEFIKRERAKGKEVVPAAALYFHITDPIIELSNSEEYNEDKCREKVVDSFAMKGIVNGDEGILELFEEKNEGKMKTLDIKETKGNMASNSKSCVTGTENIELLMKYVEKKIVSMGKEIMTGECDISPAETSGRNACSRCDYSDVCRFDSGFGNIEKTVKKMTEDEVWYKIREEMEIEAEGGKQSGLDG